MIQRSVSQLAVLWGSALAITSLCSVEARAADVVPFTSSLVAYYPLDGDSKNGAATAAGDGSDANVTYDSGKFGSAAVFNGWSHISITALGAVPQDDDARTISFWFKNVETFGDHYLFSLGDISVLDPAFSVKITLGAEPSLWVGSDLMTIVEKPLGLTDPHSEFHHAVAAFDGSVLALYLDGNLLGTSNGPLATGASEMLFGAARLGGTDFYFKGQMDDVRIYNRALTATEVGQLFAYDVQAASIPTLSEWGMIAMLLLMAGTITLGLARKRQEA